ncbi:MAG: DUF3253 domain-containing protein [Aquihabitans sp.]
MSARRAVGAAKRSDATAREESARRRVSEAKVALGERGRAWWEPSDASADGRRAEAAMRALLRNRSETSSICPSEVARIVRFVGWRQQLGGVRRAAVHAMARDEVLLTRGSERAESFDGGPVRIRRGPSFSDPS